LGERGKKWWETNKLKKKGHCLKKEKLLSNIPFQSHWGTNRKKLWRFKAIRDFEGGKTLAANPGKSDHLSLGFDI
jgi:hypothetical protein